MAGPQTEPEFTGSTEYERQAVGELSGRTQDLHGTLKAWRAQGPTGSPLPLLQPRLAAQLTCLISLSRKEYIFVGEGGE